MSGWPRGCQTKMKLFRFFYPTGYMISTYTLLNENPKLQPNLPAQFVQHSLPTLLGLSVKPKQPGQRMLAKLGRRIWLQFWIFI